jgi:hypothetical protein
VCGFAKASRYASAADVLMNMEWCGHLENFLLWSSWSKRRGKKRTKVCVEIKIQTKSLQPQTRLGSSRVDYVSQKSRSH